MKVFFINSNILFKSKLFFIILKMQISTMKKVMYLFFLFFTIISFSQTEITVLLKDLDTNLPIEEALITVFRTNQGLVSNSEGVFKVSLSRPSLIEISHTSYTKINIKSNTLEKERVNVIFLEKNIKQLKEIVLTNKHPQDILRNLVKNSQKKITVPANLRVYSREFFKRDDIYSFYNDGLMNFQILGDSKQLKTDILIEQNRTLGLVDEFDKNLLGYNLNDLMGNYYHFSYLNIILDTKAQKKYNFQVETVPQNEDYLVISVTPFLSEEGYMSDYTILYDNNKKVILEVSSFLPHDRVQVSKGFIDLKKRKIYKSVFRTTYRLESKDYYLANSKEEIGFTTEKNKKETKFEISNYLITTEFRTQTFKYKDEEIFKEKTLLNKKDFILTEFWDIDSGFLLTNKEKDIINNLKK